MNAGDVSKSSDTDDIYDSGFDNDGCEKAEITFRTIDSQEISSTEGLNSCSNTNGNCDDVSFLDSVILADNEESLSSVESVQNDREEILPSSETNVISSATESLTSAEKDFSPECFETLSSAKKNILNESEELSSIQSSPLDENVATQQESNFEFLNGITKVKEKNTVCQGLSKQNKLMKLKEIINALESNDVISLKNAALSPGGLLNDDIRRKAWPKLVGVDLVAAAPRPCQEEIEQHPYYEQVLLDVNRSLKRFPPSIQEAQRLTMLDQLVILIMRVLCKHPELHYYQGYHDICVTFLLVLGEETAYHVVEKLSQTHLRVFMERSMDPTIHLLEHLYFLIGKERPTYKDFLLKSEVGVAYCLSWLITWFSHVLNDYGTVVRFFDFFIVSHAWMPMYATTSLVLHREPGVIKQDCDMASVHSFLCNIPDDLPFEDLLTDSLLLFKSHKPKSITKERPYIKIDKRKRVKRWTFVQRFKYIPTTLVIAAAVLVTAVLYQAYKY